MHLHTRWSVAPQLASRKFSDKSSLYRLPPYRNMLVNLVWRFPKALHSGYLPVVYSYAEIALRIGHTPINPPERWTFLPPTYAEKLEKIIVLALFIEYRVSLFSPQWMQIKVRRFAKTSSWRNNVVVHEIYMLRIRADSSIFVGKLFHM